MLKTIFKIISSVILSLIIIFILITILINYYWWLNWTIRNGENFCVNKKYSIWKMLWGDNLIFFCDNKIRGKCISWISSYKLWVTKDLYLNFIPWVFAWKTKEEINKDGYVYNYKIFNGDYTKENKYYAKNYDEIIRFLKVNYNDCNLKFYSNNDIKILDTEEKEIFEKLEK